MSRVLKLNQGYEPVDIVNWKEAIRLVFLGKAEIIREYEDKYLHTVTSIFKMPAVIRLSNSFSRPKKHIKFNRRNVWARDHWVCQYCGNKFSPKELTLDHVIPRAQGGITCWENIVACCKECNNKKKNRTPEQANMDLKKRPIKPDWIPVIALSLSLFDIPESWREFCLKEV